MRRTCSGPDTACASVMEQAIPRISESPETLPSQSLMDGWLPVVISQWLDRDIEVEQTTFVTLLDGPLTTPELRKGDEDSVAMQRFTLRNTTHSRKKASFWLAYYTARAPAA